MHARPGRRLRLATLLVAILPVGSVAQERLDELDRWVPSFAFSFEAIAQPSEGAVESDRFTGPPISDGGCEAREGEREPGPCRLPVPSEIILTPNVTANDTTTAALVGFSLELMTPRLDPAPLDPRLFAHVGTSLLFAFQRKLAGDGAPGTLALPPPPAGVEGSSSNVSEETIAGNGNRSFSEWTSPIFSAGAGIALSLDLWGRRVRIKPSFEYLLQEIEFSGVARRAIQVFGSNNPRPSSIDDFRLLSFSASKTRIHHAVGGGLEIEADTQRLGPFVLSVFGGGRIYHVLGDLDQTLRSDRNELGPSFPGEEVTWRFGPKNIVWRGGVGLRFRLVPRG